MDLCPSAAQPSSPKTLTTQTGPCARWEGNGPGHKVAEREPHLGTEFRFCAVTLLAVSMSHTQQCCWGVRRKSKPGSWFKIILDLNLPEENKWWATSPRSAQNVQPKEPCESEGGWEALRSPTQLSTTRCRLWAVHCHSLSPLEPLFLPHLYWDIIDMQHMQV